MSPTAPTGKYHRLLTVLYWTTPTLFMLWVFWYGLKAWFMADDFAWLSLVQHVGTREDFWKAMFEPMAQGTVRPWSERGFFMLFRTIADIDALPYRICVFATMALNLVLISSLTYRISKSRAAAFLAPLLWTVNECLITVMTWTSAYNQAQCSAFLLGATLLLVRFAETGRWIYYALCLFVFALGFGSLEINIVFPGIALGYALFAAPAAKRFRLALLTLPLWGLSGAYYVWHKSVAPMLKDGPYAVHVDGRIFGTLGTYLRWAAYPFTWDYRHVPRWKGDIVCLVLGCWLLLYLVRALRRQQLFALFGVVWFLATIAPVLTLPDHISDYYATMPVIGSAILLAMAAADGWQSSKYLRILAVGATLAYVVVMLPVTRTGSKWWFERTHRVKTLVLGVMQAMENHPGKAVLLDGIDSELYNDSIGHSAFYILGKQDVYLVPQLRYEIKSENNMADLDDTVLAPGPTVRAIENDQAVVYSVSGDRLRNITRMYGAAARLTLSREEPRLVNVGNSLHKYLLGPGWYAIETNFRWMTDQASVRIGGARTAKDQLFLQGSAPVKNLGGVPVHLSVSVDGIPVGTTEVAEPDGVFQRWFPMPQQVVGKTAVTLSIQTDHVLRIEKERVLGLAFGKIAIREP